MVPKCRNLVFNDDEFYCKSTYVCYNVDCWHDLFNWIRHGRGCLLNMNLVLD